MNVSLARVDCTEYQTPLLVAKIFEGDGPLVGPVAKLDERLGGAEVRRMRLSCRPIIDNR